MTANATYVISCSAGYPAICLSSNTFLLLRFLRCLALFGSVLILVHDGTVLTLAYTDRLVQRGPNIFQTGSNFFQGGGGVRMLVSIETHMTCDYPGGSRPLSPLWIRTWFPVGYCIECF